jgi:hypothetical protein
MGGFGSIGWSERVVMKDCGTAMLEVKLKIRAGGRCVEGGFMRGDAIAMAMAMMMGESVLVSVTVMVLMLALMHPRTREYPTGPC